MLPDNPFETYALEPRICQVIFPPKTNIDPEIFNGWKMKHIFFAMVPFWGGTCFFFFFFFGGFCVEPLVIFVFQNGVQPPTGKAHRGHCLKAEKHRFFQLTLHQTNIAYSHVKAPSFLLVNTIKMLDLPVTKTGSNGKPTIF